MRFGFCCFFITLAVMAGAPPSYAQTVLDKEAVETLFQEKLIAYQTFISENKLQELQQAVLDFTHEDTIVLLEFKLSLPDEEPLAAQRAYFNRDPFVDLIKNAQYLDPEAFQISYQLDEFKPQYGGDSAIIHDSGTASGQMRESISGDVYTFDMTQKCRNTISADSETIFKVDSIYCRMNIEYEPLHKVIVNVDGKGEPVVEKPVIADIISEIEEKKKAASEIE